jgi:hypothetical protein
VEPNKALSEIRGQVGEWFEFGQLDSNQIRALVDNFGLLDQALSSGGSLPDAWGTRITNAAVDALLPRRPMEVCARCDHKESLHIGTVCMGVGSCRCHQFKAAPNPVPALRSAVVYDENPMVQVWFLAICQSCEPRAAQPFRNYTDRDEWAATHAAATNHSVLTPIEVKW